MADEWAARDGKVIIVEAARDGGNVIIVEAARDAGNVASGIGGKSGSSCGAGRGRRNGPDERRVYTQEEIDAGCDALARINVIFAELALGVCLDPPVMMAPGPRLQGSC